MKSDARLCRGDLLFSGAGRGPNLLKAGFAV